MAAAAASPSSGIDVADPSRPVSAVRATLRVIQAPARVFLPIKKEKQLLPPFVVQVPVLSGCALFVTFVCVPICWRWATSLLCVKTVVPSFQPAPHTFAPVSTQH